jgi:hypothetical protein
MVSIARPKAEKQSYENQTSKNNHLKADEQLA